MKCLPGFAAGYLQYSKTELGEIEKGTAQWNKQKTVDLSILTWMHWTIGPVGNTGDNSQLHVGEHVNTEIDLLPFCALCGSTCLKFCGYNKSVLTMTKVTISVSTQGCVIGMHDYGQKSNHYYQY